MKHFYLFQFIIFIVNMQIMVDGKYLCKSRKLDITTILMMNTVKWTSFAYNYEDGLRKDEELNSDQ